VVATVMRLRDRFGFAPGPSPVVRPHGAGHRYASERYGLEPGEVRRLTVTASAAPS
jgi:hypothetical protein